MKLVVTGGRHAERAGSADNATASPRLDRVSLIVWLRFEVESEEYDRRLPGIERRGEWIPVYDGRVDGATLSRSFARQRKDDALAELKRLEIPREVWEPARRYAAGLSFERAKRELADLLKADRLVLGFDAGIGPELAAEVVGRRNADGSVTILATKTWDPSRAARRDGRR